MSRPREKETLSGIFMERLRNYDQSNGELGQIYYHLFSMLPPKVLQAQLELYFEYWQGHGYTIGGADSAYFKENWFMEFHKMIRQTDFFDSCFLKYREPLTTPEEEKEFRNLNNQYHIFRKSIPEDRSLRPTEMVDLWRNSWKTQFPVEAERSIVLRQKHNNDITENVGGHIDMILWNTIHADTKNILKFVMERTFTDFQLNQKEK